MTCLVFDFDGVIVQSNQVKRDAYFTIFADLDPAGATVASALATHGDGDRYSIIGAILAALAADGRIGLDSSGAAAVEGFAEAYNAICEAYAATCEEVPGAQAALAALAPRHSLYLCSATPQEPLRRIVARRGLDHYFRQVLGRPLTKTDHLRAIIAREQIVPLAMVMIGDGRHDLGAARAVGCHFIGVRNMFNDFDPAGLQMVDDLTTLGRALRQLEGL